MLPPKPSRCQHCGFEAEVADVTFRQNIGMFVMRRTKQVSGRFCKACIQEMFLSYSLVTLFLGWWGTISFFITPTYLVLNFIALTKSFGLAVPGARPARQATPRTLTTNLMNKIEPHTPEILRRLKAHESLEQVANDIAARAKVTPGEVKLYVAELVRVAKKKRQQAA